LKLAARAVLTYTYFLWTLARIERPDVIFVIYPGYLDVRIVASVAGAVGFQLCSTPMPRV